MCEIVKAWLDMSGLGGGLLYVDYKIAQLLQYEGLMDIRQICITHLHTHNSRITHVRRNTYTRKHAKESDYQASVHLKGLMIGLGQLNLRNSNC